MPSTPSTQQILPMLQALSKADKLVLMQFLVSELAQEEAQQSVNVEGHYLDWKLYDATDAASTLLNLLEKDQ